MLSGETGYQVRLPADCSQPLGSASEWRGAQYADGSLPFSLRSAPNVADALQWVMLDSGVSMVDHYLDGFVTMGNHRSSKCCRNLDRTLAI